MIKLRENQPRRAQEDAMKITTLVLILFILAAIFATYPAFFKATPTAAQEETAPPVYFAGGCFWGTEHMMSLVPGVIDVTSGYANGTVDNPDYRTVVSGTTGHRETVKVTYNPAMVTLTELVELFFSSIDPTVENRQGNDIGSQYQTGIYYTNEEDGAVISRLAEAEKGKHPAFVVEIAPLSAFYDAEDYHQDYLIKNPWGYCHLGPDDFERAKQTGKQEAPRKAEYRSISPEEAKKRMDAGEALIIVDVREPYEFDAGHIPGAINLPLGSLVDLAKTQLPDKDALIYLYCRSGARSRSGAMLMVKEGYTNLYDLGGIINWPYEVVK